MSTTTTTTTSSATVVDPAGAACPIIDLNRQVRLVAGTLVLLGVGLGFTVHQGFFGLAGFVGAGLVFAGLTNICGMCHLLALLPWNRPKRSR